MSNQAGDAINKETMSNQAEDAINKETMSNQENAAIVRITAMMETMGTLVAIIMLAIEQPLIAGILFLIVGVLGIPTVVCLSRVKVLMRVVLAVFFLGIFALGLLIVVSLPPPPPPPPTPLPALKYDFEEDIQGWIPQVYTDTMGVTNVVLSCEEAKSRNCSLELIVDLEGQDLAKKQGEARVDLRSDPPLGVNAPVNLSGQTITCWILLRNKDIEGWRDAWNGIQVFAKSVNNDEWESEYGTWKNLGGQTGRWFKVTLSPSASPQPTPYWGFRDRDFDPKQIVSIGIKIAINDKSLAVYKGGGIFIDACDW